MFIKPLVCIAILAGLGAAPVHATEWMYCSGEGAQIGLLQGSLETFSTSAVTLEVGTETWVTDLVYGPGTIIAIAQGFEDRGQLLVDLYDSNVSSRVAALRLFRAEEGDTIAYGGVLHMPGRGAWTVACDST